MWGEFSYYSVTDINPFQSSIFFSAQLYTRVMLCLFVYWIAKQTRHVKNEILLSIFCIDEKHSFSLLINNKLKPCVVQYHISLIDRLNLFKAKLLVYNILDSFVYCINILHTSMYFMFLWINFVLFCKKNIIIHEKQSIIRL